MMKLPAKLPAAVLFAAIFARIAATGAKYVESPARPLLINDSVSSEVINETNCWSVRDCLYRCHLRDCATASVSLSSGVCQLLLINDASRTPGPNGTHAARAVGSEAGVTVWKADNFEELLRARRLTNFTVQFGNSSWGSNGSIQHLVIPVSGCYRIEASGAAGGGFKSLSKVGGRGAFIAGSFNLSRDTQLSVVVGQAGGDAANENCGGGGGGGSFVWRTMASQLLLAAGGGGGVSSNSFSNVSRDGLPGEAGTRGSDSLGMNPEYGGFGGADGQPGFNEPRNTSSISNHGGCGAGWLAKALNPRRNSFDGERGGSLADGWVGGRAGDGNTGDGGFGGGGGGGAYSSSSNTKGAPGAGGGFSGGGAGVGFGHAGGGGGSLCGGVSCVYLNGRNSDSPLSNILIRLLEDTC